MMYSIKQLQWMLTILGVILLFWLPSAHAESGKVTGYLLAAGKDVVALGKNGATRQLKRRSPVYEGDTIITKSQPAQIRFADGSLTSLRPDTRFKIETFRWDGKQDGSERSFFSLLKGGLRTITGAIGKKNKANYQMKTPVATIGIRGTEYEVVIRHGKLVGVVVEGAIGLFNEKGTTVVKAGGVNHYFRVDQNGKVERSTRPFAGVNGSRTDQGSGNGGDGNGEGNGDGDGDGDGGTDGNDVADNDNGGDSGTTTTPDQAKTTESVDGTTTYTTTREVISGMMGAKLDFERQVDANGDEIVDGVTGKFKVSNKIEHGVGSAEIKDGSDYVFTFETVQDHKGNYVPGVLVKAEEHGDNGTKLIFEANSPRQFNEADHGEFEGSDFKWHWGRWAVNTWEDNNEQQVDSFFYTQGEGITTLPEMYALGQIADGTATFGGSIASGKIVDSQARDHHGKLMAVTHLSFSADFLKREISGFKLELTCIDAGGCSYTPAGTFNQTGGPVGFSQALGGNGPNDPAIPISTGVGTGHDSGEATAVFMGSNADHAVGVFSVTNDSGSAGAAGVYAVEKN